ncbi:MAG: hypothetical protein ACK4M4_11445, partial [Flavobacterium sp.]
YAVTNYKGYSLIKPPLNIVRASKRSFLNVNSETRTLVINHKNITGCNQEFLESIKFSSFHLHNVKQKHPLIGYGHAV